MDLFLNFWTYIADANPRMNANAANNANQLFILFALFAAFATDLRHSHHVYLFFNLTHNGHENHFDSILLSTSRQSISVRITAIIKATSDSNPIDQLRPTIPNKINPILTNAMGKCTNIG